VAPRSKKILRLGAGKTQKDGSLTKCCQHIDMSAGASRIKSIPFIDPNVEYVGVNKLRSFNSSNLGEIKKMLVLQDNDRPLAVMMSYDQYLTVQKKLQEALDALELLGREENRDGLRRGLRDTADGRVAPLKKGSRK